MSKFQKISISNLGITVTGKTPSSNSPEDFGDEFMFVTPSDNLDQKNISSTDRYLSQIGLDKLNSKALPPKSVLVSCIGTAMGKVSMNKTTCITNQQINSIKVNSSLFNADYIYYSLKNNYSLLRNAASGSTALPLLNKTDFDLIEINIHKLLTTQQKIAAVLSALDDKIELNNKINAELEAMAKTLYDYWFVQFDFPDPLPSPRKGETDGVGSPYKSSGGKMVYNATLKREIPEGWEVKSLGDCLNCNANSLSKNNTFSTINYLDTSNLTENRIGRTQIINSDLDVIPSRAQRIVQKNDILISTVRPNLRHYGIIKKPEPNMIASTGFTTLSHKSDNALNDFFYMHITSDAIQKKLESIAASAVSSYPSINPSDILTLPVLLPSDNLIIEKISKILSNCFSTISLNQAQNQELSSLRDWLLPMLMNGQVSVGKVYEVVEEVLSMAAEGEVGYGK